MVHPDLPNTRKAWMVAYRLDALAQGVEVVIGRIVHVERVDAQGEVHVGMGIGQRLGIVPLAAEDGRDDDGPHTVRTGRGEHGVTVGIEFGGVEMAVGIDQHDWSVERVMDSFIPACPFWACRKRRQGRRSRWLQGTASTVMRAQKVFPAGWSQPRAIDVALPDQAAGLACAAPRPAHDWASVMANESMTRSGRCRRG